MNETVIFVGDELIEQNRRMKLHNEIYENIRKQRNLLLTQTDKYIMADFPVDPQQKSLWLEYRKKLRDFPLTCRPYEENGELKSVEWPVAPNL
tara:strand:+ start:1532 stop:1810 length:279 start_codon:yes stop_codon:yes gene_type:complete